MHALRLLISAPISIHRVMHNKMYHTDINPRVLYNHSLGYILSSSLIY